MDRTLASRLAGGGNLPLACQLARDEPRRLQKDATSSRRFVGEL